MASALHRDSARGLVSRVRTLVLLAGLDAIGQPRPTGRESEIDGSAPQL